MVPLISKEKTNKRSIIHPERLAELKQVNAMYIITCETNQFSCKEHETGCWRGFFSLFIQALYGIYFSKQLQIPYYIDFGNVLYRYADVEKFNGDKNFWNHYFEQPGNLPTGVNKIINRGNEIYPLRIWDRKFIRDINRVTFEQIIVRKETIQFLAAHTQSFIDTRVLGIHVRRTDHYHEVRPAKLSTYFKLIDSNINQYDKLFVATDDEEVIRILSNRYRNKLFFNPTLRSSGKIALHSDKRISDHYRLGQEALLDCYCLSICAKAILSPSNLSYAALLFNPQLPYILAESTQARWKRWKTLFLFYLDKWNIRKW